MKNYLDALKRRKEETGESGFSLIELIVVVVILGVLAAIAIPVFNNLQLDAQDKSAEAIAGNGASQIAAELGDSSETTAGNTASLAGMAADAPDVTITVEGNTLTTFCVTAKHKNGYVAKSGPGTGCTSIPRTP